MTALHPSRSKSDMPREVIASQLLSKLKLQINNLKDLSGNFKFSFGPEARVDAITSSSANGRWQPMKFPELQLGHTSSPDGWRLKHKPLGFAGASFSASRCAFLSCSCCLLKSLRACRWRCSQPARASGVGYLTQDSSALPKKVSVPQALSRPARHSATRNAISRIRSL